MMNKPVSLYIHIPFCKSKCPYCDFYSARPEEDEVLDRYLAALCARLAVYGEKYGERLLHTVYFGRRYAECVRCEKTVPRARKSERTV